MNSAWIGFFLAFFLAGAVPARAGCDGALKGAIVSELMDLMEEWIEPANRVCPPKLEGLKGVIPERGRDRTTLLQPVTAGKPVFSAGKIWVLDFWSSSCAPCMAALPEVEKLRQAVGSKAETAFVTHYDGGQDEKRLLHTVRQKRAENLMVAPVVVTEAWENVQKSFKLVGIPRIVVLDKRGRIAWQGSASQRVDEVVKTLYEEELPAQSECN